jgi:hypothetical protein
MSSRSTGRKPSGFGSSSGRLRLIVLLATAAACLLVPAAQAFANGTATVEIEGSGTGEVVATNESDNVPYDQFKTTPQIACSYASPGPATGTCAGVMPKVESLGEVEGVVLKATPGPGSEFVEWTIVEGVSINEIFGEEVFCRPGSEPRSELEESNFPGGVRACWVYNESSTGFGAGEDVKVKAVFGPAGPANPTPLTIAKTGEGTVTSNPTGIECTGAKTGAECEHAFELNEMVELTASPAAGYAFSAWAGCTEHVGLTCKVKMEKAKTVKVTFVATPSLTIEKAGSGQGKVGATGISCDENCSKATSAIKTGTAVTVKVTPAKGSEAAVFENGTGSASACSGGSCAFTISANSSVKVKFSPIPTKTLTVNLTGPAAYKGKVTGKGTLKGLTASAINCGTGCTTQTESFLSGDTVTLTAVAGTGYTFAGWSGAGCSGIGTCAVSTSSDQTVSAEFK